MQPNHIPSPYTIGSLPTSERQHPALAIELAHLIEYFGIVNYSTNERVLGLMKDSLIHDPETELTLIVTSAGGPSGTAMSFYDTVRTILRPHLTTVGTGDVDSSGVILFLTGSMRLITPHTTMLLHPAGRSFDAGKRYTADEIGAMVTEDRMKDEQYAKIIEANTQGKLNQTDVLALMTKHSVLGPEEIVSYGLAHEILN